MRRRWQLQYCVISLLATTFMPCALLLAEESIAETDVTSSATPSLSLADLEHLAISNNPTLGQAAAQIESSRGKALEAGLYPNPTIGYEAEQIGAAGTPGEIQGGFLRQTIMTAGKLRLSRAKYNQEAFEGEIIAAGQKLVVLNGIRIRYYELLAQQRIIGLRREMLANAEESLRTRREMFNTGLANEAEVLLSEIEVNRARIQMDDEENHFAALWQRLVAITGTPDLPPTPISGSLEADSPALVWEDSLAITLEHSPEMQAARAHVVHDQITVQRERVQPIPDIQLQTSSGYNFETNNVVVGQVQLGIALPVWDRNQGTIMQAKADLARSTGEVRRLELALRERLAEAFRHYRTAYVASQLYRDQNVPKAARAYKIQRDMYEKRRVEWPEVVKLQQNLFEVQSEYTAMLLALRRSEVAITGLLMVDGTSSPPSPRPSGHIDATPRPR